MMTKDEIRSVFESLARSQGFYGRLLARLTDDDYEALEGMGFSDPLDLILAIEG